MHAYSNICIYKDKNCLAECVRHDAYAMSHLSAVNLATSWLGTRVDARAAAVSMIYAAASLSQSKVHDADRPLAALSVVVKRLVHIQRTVKCSQLRRETGRTCCVESVCSATFNATGRHRADLAAKPLVGSTYSMYVLFTRRRASADRTARRQFQAAGQPVSRTQASDGMTSWLPRYEAKCVQRRCFQ